MKVRYYIIFLVALIFNIALSQDNSDFVEEDISLPKQTLIQETIDELKINPLNLNTVKYDELIIIPYLSPILVNKIIALREKSKSFKTISELLKIPEIDQQLIDKISPLLDIATLPLAKTNVRHRLRLNYDTLSHITQTSQSEITSNTRLISLTKDVKLEAVILTDKDINETKISDFFSSSIAVSNNNSKLVMGNYIMNYGSQLIFAGPYSYLNSIKNFTALATKSINAMTGIYENKSLFGIAYSLEKNYFFLSAYLSSVLLDAEIKNSAVKKVYYYTKYIDSLSQTRRERLRNNIYGTRLSYLPNQSFLISTAICHNEYDQPFAPSDSSNSFYGKTLNLWSVDMKSVFGNYFLAGEFGYAIKYGLGFSSQIIGDWKTAKVNFNLYYQAKNFYSPHSKWRELTNRKENLTASFNIYYNLSGFQMYLLTSTRQNFTTDSLPARVQYCLERKQGLTNLSIALKGTYKETNLQTYGTRFNLSYQINKNFLLDARIEDKYLKNTSKSGHLFAAGVKYHTNYLKSDLRLYYFNINSSDCRIYAYEPNRNSYTFNNKGIRIFADLEYNIKKTFKLNYYLGFTKAEAINFDSGLEITLDVR